VRTRSGRLRKGIDITSGFHVYEPLPAKYNVAGVMLGQPFKITKIGPVGLFVRTFRRSEAFFTERRDSSRPGR